MAPSFPEMTWTLCDRQENHQGMSWWLRDFPRTNIRGPLLYDIGKTEFPEVSADVVYTANTLHIISWELCLQFFDDLKAHLKEGARLMIYGAFNYQGQFSSESNKKFNDWLLDRDKLSGIRNFEDVQEQLNSRQFEFIEDIEMPSNNRMLVFEKK